MSFCNRLIHVHAAVLERISGRVIVSMYIVVLGWTVGCLVVAKLGLLVLRKYISRGVWN